MFNFVLLFTSDSEGGTSRIHVQSTFNKENVIRIKARVSSKTPPRSALCLES